MLFGEQSNSLIRHLASHYQGQDIPTYAQLRATTKVELLWTGKALSLQKSFGVLRCRLCSKERLATLKAKWCQPALIMNSPRMEVHEVCKHRASFHRLRMLETGADDSG